MVELLALVPCLIAGAITMGIIILWIPDLLFRGGKEQSSFEPDEQSKLSNFLEWIVFICLFPIGLIAGFLVSIKAFTFLTGQIVY